LRHLLIHQSLARASCPCFSAASVGEVVVEGNIEGSRYLIAALPITASSREALREQPVFVDQGITYALDRRQRLRGAFDNAGDSISYDYDAKNRLAGVQVRNAAGWRLSGSCSDDGASELQLHSPRGDDVLYRFAADGALAETRLNGRTTELCSWSENRTKLIIKHLQRTKKWGIGQLDAQETDAVVATETVTRQPGRLRYEQQLPGRPPQSVLIAGSGNEVRVEGDGLPNLRLVRKSDALIEEDGPDGRFQYEYDPKSGRLKSIGGPGGDYVKFLAGERQTDDSQVVLQARRGKAVAEVSVAPDRVSVRGFDDRRVTYQYRDGRLVSVESPLGKTTYQYSGKDDRLAAIRYPDGSSERFEWTEAPGLRRLRTWREAAAP